MTTSRPVPLRPDYAARGRPSDHLIRAIVATALANFDVHARGAERIAKAVWPDDNAVPLILRAATAPADTTTSGWASELAATALADIVQTLGPTNCAGELFRRAIALEFAGANQINVPGIVAAATDAAWIVQGAPMPVRQLSVGNGAQLVPKTLRVGLVATRELLEHSIPNAERVIRAQVTEGIGAALDAAVFDDAAASSSRPAGIRNSATAVTAATGGSDAAMMKDLGALAAAVTAVGGLQLAFVASPGGALKIALRAGADFNARFPIFASGGLAAGTVLAVALPALVSAVDPAVRFDIATESAAHLEGASPAAIGTSGTPNIISAPVRSFWQTDTVGLRLRLEAAWGLRASAASCVAFVTSVTW